MALTTRASVKTQAGIPSADTSRDSQIDLLILGVESLVKQQTGRNLESASYTEYYSGDNSPFLMLRQYPVTAVSAVYYDDSAYFGTATGAFAASTLLTNGVDYCLVSGQNGTGSQGILRRIGTVWYGRPSREIGVVENLPPIPAGNIKVQYTAGYVALPAAITMGVNLLISQLMTQAAAGSGIQSMTYEDASVTYLSPDVAAKAWGSISSIFANYRSIPV